MPALYYFYSNGLRIASEIFLPELQEISETDAAVTIKYGKVPERLNNIIAEYPLRQISATEFLFDIKGTARYCVGNNNEVIIHKYEGAEEDAVRIYLLSTVFAALLHKNDLLPLHASTVNIDGTAALIAGASGAGKSTTALGLLKKGYEILNDDISTIDIDPEKGPIVFSGYTHLKLWEKSLNDYNHTTENLRQLRRDIKKYSFPIERKIPDNNLPIKTIIFLQVKQVDQISHKPASGIALFDGLRKNTFRHRLAKELGKSETYFNKYARLASAINSFTVLRPEHCDPELLADYIEQILLT